MLHAPTTALDRIALLLPHLNDDQPNPKTLRRDLTAFIQSFDGSAAAGFIEVISTPTTLLIVNRTVPVIHSDRDSDVTDNTLIGLIAELHTLLRQGLTGGPIFDGTMVDFTVPLSSLSFSVRGVPRPKPQWRKGEGVRIGGRVAKTTYEQAGRFVIRVAGNTRDLVIFLVVHLLTLPGMVRLEPCARPGCQRFVINDATAGRPRTFCVPACGALAKQEQRMKVEQRQSVKSRKRSR